MRPDDPWTRNEPSGVRRGRFSKSVGLHLTYGVPNSDAVSTIDLRVERGTRFELATPCLEGRYDLSQRVSKPILRNGPSIVWDSWR